MLKKVQGSRVLLQILDLPYLCFHCWLYSSIKLNLVKFKQLKICDLIYPISLNDTLSIQFTFLGFFQLGMNYSRFEIKLGFKDKVTLQHLLSGSQQLRSNWPPTPPRSQNQKKFLFGGRAGRLVGFILSKGVGGGPQNKGQGTRSQVWPRILGNALHLGFNPS